MKIDLSNLSHTEAEQAITQAVEAHLGKGVVITFITGNSTPMKVVVLQVLDRHGLQSLNILKTQIKARVS